MKQQNFVPIMTKKQSRQYYCLVALWLIMLVWFWSWWLEKNHIVSIIGMVLTSVTLLYTTVFPGYLFFFVGRMKKTAEHLQPPKGRYAMVVTKAPGEPWEILEKTLEAMLTQEFPYKYDVWLATEKLDEEIMEWCIKHTVNISCRDGFAEYQQDTFPRRKKCKEGNLSFFYDKYGYIYDFVAQLDADHVPTTTYLLEVMRPFTDPEVGYVAAPSICDANIQESWVVRARLYAEASMHGALQAGYCYDWAPLPIGSHYAVRVKALKSLVHRRGIEIVSQGTLGPELAEDHSTGLAMQSNGWKGAFAIEAIAHGDGAGSFADSITQEFQWARSLVNLFLIWTKGYWRGLKGKAHLKFEFSFSQLWYPLLGIVMLLGISFPIVALLTGLPWVTVPLVEFIIRSSILVIYALAVVLFIKRHEWFRPSYAPIVSWELVLFQFIRWPWVVYACTQSILGVIFKKEFAFKVTPKNSKGAKPLPIKVLLPYIIICLANLVTLWFANNPGKAVGYTYFCLLNAGIYVAVMALVVILHIKENWEHLNIPLVKLIKYTGGNIAVISLLGVLTVNELFSRYTIIFRIFGLDSESFVSLIATGTQMVRNFL